MNAYNAQVSTIWKMYTKEYYISKKEKCTYFNNLENVHKRFSYFQERKMHMCQEFGKLDFQKKKDAHHNCNRWCWSHLCHLKMYIFSDFCDPNISYPTSRCHVYCIIRDWEELDIFIGDFFTWIMDNTSGICFSQAPA